MFLFAIKILALLEVLYNTSILCPELSTWSPLASRKSVKEIVNHDNNFRSTLKKKQAEKQEEYEYCTDNIHVCVMQTSSFKNTYL